jgi:hypothetical protein
MAEPIVDRFEIVEIDKNQQQIALLFALAGKHCARCLNSARRLANR